MIFVRSDFEIFYRTHLKIKLHLTNLQTIEGYVLGGTETFITVGDAKELKDCSSYLMVLYPSISYIESEVPNDRARVPIGFAKYE